MEIRCSSVPWISSAKVVIFEDVCVCVCVCGGGGGGGDKK